MSSTPESERGRWTPATGDVLERLRHRKETRLRFLHALYEAAEGSTSNGVRFKELGEQLGLTEEETWIVRSYLANEGLLSGATIVYIVITHQGRPCRAVRQPGRHLDHPRGREGGRGGSVGSL